MPFRLKTRVPVSNVSICANSGRRHAAVSAYVTLSLTPERMKLLQQLVRSTPYETGPGHERDLGRSGGDRSQARRNSRVTLCRSQVRGPDCLGTLGEPGRWARGQDPMVRQGHSIYPEQLHGRCRSAVGSLLCTSHACAGARTQSRSVRAVIINSGRPFFTTGGLAEPLRLENPDQDRARRPGRPLDLRCVHRIAQMRDTQTGDDCRIPEDDRCVQVVEQAHSAPSNTAARSMWISSSTLASRHCWIVWAPCTPTDFGPAVDFARATALSMPSVTNWTVEPARGQPLGTWWVTTKAGTSHGAARPSRQPTTRQGIAARLRPNPCVNSKSPSVLAVRPAFVPRAIRRSKEAAGRAGAPNSQVSGHIRASGQVDTSAQQHTQV
jgi:hypothetical protein